LRDEYISRTVFAFLENGYGKLSGPAIPHIHADPGFLFVLVDHGFYKLFTASAIDGQFILRRFRVRCDAQAEGGDGRENGAAPRFLC